jgi:hypothetical protein
MVMLAGKYMEDGRMFGGTVIRRLKMQSYNWKLEKDNICCGVRGRIPTDQAFLDFYFSKKKTKPRI